MKTKQISVQLWMVIVFVTLGFLLQLISFCAPFWNKLSSETLGLWLRCPSTGCVAVTRDYLADSMEVGRALQALGLACYLVLIVLVVLFICWRSDLRLLTVAIFTAFLILFAVIIGALMWSSSSNTTIYWAYYICYMSGLSVSAAGGVLIHVRRQVFLATIDKTETEMEDV